MQEQSLYEDDGLRTILKKQIFECESFENLYLIRKMLAKSIPLKTIMSKNKSDWMPSGETKYVDMDNGFTLIKFANEMNCHHVFRSTMVSSRPNFQPPEVEA